ncbi:MAG: hypothetical protein ACTH5D_10920 [Halomonas sp.]|uniref:hypothetical protein n=1 Tax=Halomonas sp. TaxID=1486246 RepID=UPI003F8E19A0
MRLLAILIISAFLSGCGTEAQVTAIDGTPLEVIQSATGKEPTEARVVESTRYMSVVFHTSSMSTRGHLLDVKRAMQVILEEYPDVDSFFFGWKHQDNPSQYYMKINFSRSRVGDGDWVNVMVDDIPNYADDYWLIPALR